MSHKERDCDDKAHIIMVSILRFSTDIASYHYVCKHCFTYRTFQLEDIIEHGQQCSSMPRPIAYKFRYVCFMCEYGSYLRGEIRAHILKHIGVKPFKCSLCSIAFTRKFHLLAHIRNKHGPNAGCSWWII